MLIAGQVINGFVTGAMYALVAIGFSLVIGVLDKLNFAHPDVFMFGGFLALATLSVLPLPLAFLVIFLGGGIMGLLVELIAFRRFTSNDSKVTAALASMAIGLVLTDLVQKYWGTEPVTVNVPSDWLQQSFQIAGIAVLNLQIVILIVTFVLMGALHALLKRTRIGRQIRALAESSVSASLLGINVKRVAQSVFFISSALATTAGLLVALRGGSASSDIGLNFGLKALAIMAIGGLGDLRGAVAGGLLVGVLEALMYVLGLGNLVEMTVWVVMIAILMVKPGGLFAGVDRYASALHGQRQLIL
jgi:branched-chain amino acid transport system permease protein